MSTEGRAEKNRGVDASQFKVTAGNRPDALGVLDNTTIRIRELAGELAALMDKYKISKATLSIAKGDPQGGELVFERFQGGKLELSLEGPLGKDFADIPKGTPFTAAEFPGETEVYFRPTPERPMYAKNGDVVRKGQPVLYAVHGKNTKWPIGAPISGTITFVVEQGQRVGPKRQAREGDNHIEKEADILFYIDPTN